MKYYISGLLFCVSLLLHSDSEQLPSEFAYNFNCATEKNCNLLLNNTEFEVTETEGKYKYYGNNAGDFYCEENSPSKKIKWKRTLGAPILSKPLILEDKVVFGSKDGALYALNKDNGNIAWKYLTAGEVLSSASANKEQVVFSSTDGNIYSVTQKHGARKWLHLATAKINTNPVVFKDKVFFGDSDGNFYCLNADNGSLLWKIPLTGTILPHPTAEKNTLYMATTKAILAIDLRSGKQLWKVGLPKLERAQIQLAGDNVLLYDFTDSITYYSAYNGKKLGTRFKQPVKNQKIYNFDGELTD